MHEQPLLALVVLDHGELGRALVYEGKDGGRGVLVESLAVANDKEGVLLHLGVKLFHFLVKHVGGGDARLCLEIRELIHWHIVQLHSPVLYASAVLALVFVLRLDVVIVFHDEIVVFIDIYLGTLAHHFLHAGGPAGLDSDMLVHLRLEYAELVGLRLGRHAQPAIAVGAIGQSRPEIRELSYHLGIVRDGRAQVTRLVVEHASVKEGQEVFRLHLDDKIEVSNGPVVIA